MTKKKTKKTIAKKKTVKKKAVKKVIKKKTVAKKPKTVAAGTHVAFLLDETGSMSIRKHEVITGFNDFIKGLKGTPDIDLTLTTFNSNHYGPRYTATPIKKVPNLTAETYNPNDGTPLYDAIGKTIRSMEKQTKRADKVLFVIQTDGEENCSQEFNKNAIVALIKQKEKDGWTFLFLGADMTTAQATTVSSSLGLRPGQTYAYAGQHTGSTMRSIATATAAYASAVGPVSGAVALRASLAKDKNLKAGTGSTN